MTDDRDRTPGTTTAEDEAFIAGARRLGPVLRHPFTIALLSIAAVAVIFRLGISVGRTVHAAFDGDGTMAVAFGAILVTLLVALIGVGVWLDRRRRVRDGEAPSSSGDQHR